MTLFDERLEGEIKTHENEMLHKAIIKKYGSKDLSARIKYVLSVYRKDSWTAEEMFAKLQELEIDKPETIADIEYALQHPDNIYLGEE